MNEYFTIAFNKTKFSFLFDGASSNDFLVGFFIEYGENIAYFLAIVGLIYELFKIMSSQNTSIHMFLIRTAVVIFLITNYGPIMKNVVTYADDLVSQLILQTNRNTEKTLTELRKEERRQKEKAEKTQSELTEKELTPEDYEALENEVIYDQSMKNIEPEGFNPKKKFWKMNIWEIIACILMALSQIAVTAVCVVKNAFLALALIVGRIAIVGYACEKTEKLMWGWFASLVNILSWPLWLAIILYLQTTFLPKIFFSDSTEEMIFGVTNLAIFLVMYIMIYSFSKDLMAGSLGVMAGSLISFGAVRGGGKLLKGTAKGAVATAKGIGGGIGYAKNKIDDWRANYGNEINSNEYAENADGTLSQMDSSLEEVPTDSEKWLL